jgi:ubiquitin-conjugating enzyme E2 D
MSSNNKCIKYTRSVNKRLQKDLKVLISNSHIYKENNSSFRLDDNSIIYDVKCINKNGKDFYLILNGQKDTLYEECKVVFRVKSTERYPYFPPEVKCVTKVYHPNVDDKGNICLDILKKGWLPTLTFTSIAENLSTFLINPNADDPLNVKVSNVYKSDRIEYNRTVKQYISKYASDGTYKSYLVGITE